MTDKEFPFRNFTVRAEGYDRGEVDGLVDELQGEIGELRRTIDAANPTAEGDARLHDPEGAVTRTLAIAQETADRVLHDAQVESDRRRSEADEQAAATLADADSRAAKMMADIETQTAEVRAQGIAAARSAIQVERDKAVAELGQIRRVRDDIRSEAVELKATLERYARQATEASDVLGAAATGPLLASELPDFVADDIALAGVIDDGASSEDSNDAGTDIDDVAARSSGRPNNESTPVGEPAPLAAVADRVDEAPSDDVVWGDDSVGNDTVDTDSLETDSLEEDPAIASSAGADNTWADEADTRQEPPLADVIAIDGDITAAAESLPVDDDDDDDAGSAGSGAFLSEVRAAADDNVMLSPESEGSDDSDRFLSELRGVTESVDIDSVDLDNDAADRFFDGD